MSSARGAARPVLGMVSSIGVAVFVLGALAWSGVINPRVDVGPQRSSVMVDALPGDTATAIGVVNQGATEVTVEGVTWGGSAAEWPEAWRPRVMLAPEGADGMVEVEHLEAFEPFALTSGADRTLVLLAAVPCPETLLYSPIPDVKVEVKASSGRTVHFTYSEGHNGPPAPPICW